MSHASVNPPKDTGFVEAEFADAYPKGIENHYWMQARNRIVHRLLRKTMSIGTGPVLEIGCGPGIVTEYMRRQSIECRGCDISIVEPCSASAAPHLDLGMDAADLPEPIRLNVKYLMMLDVLEHIEKPAEFLSRCLGRFANVRSILITVPARMEVWSNYDVYYRHFKRYDQRTIHELYRPNELTLRDQGYFFHALYPPARLLKLSKSDRQTKLSAPGFTLPHTIVAAAFNIEQMILPRSIPGTSLYGILDRNV